MLKLAIHAGVFLAFTFLVFLISMYFVRSDAAKTRRMRGDG